jgi:peptidoglycan hydrolase-like protein with peptidoglycan-binding domain
MTRNLRPALPALILMLSAVGLGVPAGSAQSKGPAKKKPAASTAKPPSAKAAAAGSPSKASAKSTPAEVPAAKKASGTAPKGSPRSGASSRTGKRAGSRSRRQPGQKAPTSDRVSQIQAALAKDGSFSGTPDGKWNDDTAAAIRRFQASHRLNPTGRLDALTLQKLGLGSETAGVAAPTPPPGAVSRLTSSAAASSATMETARRE